MDTISSCIACRENIKLGAVKCIHCGQCQNWKRYFDCRIMLSLLVAILAVTGIIIPLIEKILTVEKAQLQLALVEGAYHDTDFIIGNIGKRSAVITRITIEHLNSPIKTIRGWPLNTSLLGKIVEPNKSYKIESIVKKKRLLPLAITPINTSLDSNYLDKCNISIQLTQHNGAVEIQSLPFFCKVSNVDKLTNQPSK